MAVHTAADTETVGFSAAGVDRARWVKMAWSADAYERNRGDAIMRWMGTTNRRRG